MNKAINYKTRIIFDHLPKTAGTAISASLVNVLGANNVTTILNGTHQKAIDLYGKNHLVIAGHFLFEGEGLDKNYRYITCIREPVDRAISWLYFVLNNHKEKQLGELWRGVERFIQSEGDDLRQDVVANISNIYVEHFSAIYNSSTEIEDFEKFNAAISALNQYAIVGFYENLNEFLERVRILIHQPELMHLSYLNVTRRRPTLKQVSPKLLKKIQALNALDIKLYQHLLESEVA